MAKLRNWLVAQQRAVQTWIRTHQPLETRRLEAQHAVLLHLTGEATDETGDLPAALTALYRLDEQAAALKQAVAVEPPDKASAILKHVDVIQAQLEKAHEAGVEEAELHKAIEAMRALRRKASALIDYD